MKNLFIVLGILTINDLIYSQSYCEFIKDVKNYQSKVRLINNENSIDSSTFNIDSYLSIFNLLHQDDNLEYCYAYYNSGLEGQPILYVKDEKFDVHTYVKTKMIQAKDEIAEKSIRSSLYEKDPIKSIEQKRETQDWISESYRKGYSAEYKTSPEYTLKNHLIPENSEMGYFQYLYFSQMGESFAGFWHSIERNVICSYEEFDLISKYYENISEEEDSLSPIVLLEKSKCIITWYEYIERNGIYRRKYEINRFAPFEIERVESKLFASEIDDGILY